MQQKKFGVQRLQDRKKRVVRSDRKGHAALALKDKTAGMSLLC